jgi:hypothetical protein
MSGFLRTDRSDGPPGAGCGWFLLSMLGAFIVLMVIADALGATWP